MKQPDEEPEDLMGRDDTPGVWWWVLTFLAFFGIAGLVVLYASYMPLNTESTTLAEQ